MPVVVNLVTRTVDAHEVNAVSRTSLAEIAPATTGWVDLYAGDPAAFDEAQLRDDESPALHQGPIAPGIDGLEDFSTVNHALGVLLNRGLQHGRGPRGAGSAGRGRHTDVVVVARRIVSSVYP